MSRETRIVRPFVLGDRLDRCLSGMVLQFGALRCEPGGKILMEDPDEYLRSTLRLTWEASESRFAAFRKTLLRGLADHGIEPDAVALVAIAHTRYLKIASILIHHPVSRLNSLGRELVFRSNERPRALRTSTHGATVTAYLALTQSIEPVPLRPWRKGTWLARAMFRIQTGGAHQLFQPTPMDDMTRSEFKLPEDCIHYLHMDSHEPLRPFRETSAPVFYVDADVLTRLDRTAGTAIGRAMQAQLACDFVAGVIMDVAAQGGDAASLSWDKVESSLFGRIVTMAAGKGASVERCREVGQLVRTDPGQLLSLVEGAVKLRPGVVTALSADE